MRIFRIQITDHHPEISPILGDRLREMPGGQSGLPDTTCRLIEERVSAAEINNTILANHLYNAEMPDADLVIRTGGANSASKQLPSLASGLCRVLLHQSPLAGFHSQAHRHGFNRFWQQAEKIRRTYCKPEPDK